MTPWHNGAPQVGDVAEMQRTVTATDIERFTQISGDRNPLHYDLEAARASRFGEIVVQGGITSAILNAVVNEANLEGRKGRYEAVPQAVEDDSLKAIQFLTPGMLGWALSSAGLFGAAAVEEHQLLRDRGRG